MNFSPRIHYAPLCAVILLYTALLVSGCGRTIILPPPTTPAARTTSAHSTAVQADAAWQKGDTTQATSLYRNLANDVTASTADRSIACERLARLALAKGDSIAAQTALNQWKLIVPGVDSTPVWQDLQNQSRGTAPSAQATFSAVCVAMALPTTGNYAPFGAKITAGAKVAQNELTQAGTPIDLRIINSESTDWITQIEQLPQQCVAVGGPLRYNRYIQLKNAGIPTKRAIFAFIPALDATDEGSITWRFFPSQADQIQAVLQFASDLGIDRYGLLYPTDTYGNHMSTLFADVANKYGAVAKIASYDPNAPGTWNDIMKSFTGSSMRGKIPIPTTTFQAAFIPDSWENVERLTPFLFYQGEDRLVIMGTALWEQGLSNRSSVNVANLDLAVFPGAWNASSPNATAAALIEALAAGGDTTPALWEGTGYDFVRFASLLNLQQPVNPGEVNRRITAIQGMDWAIAPITWNNGQASQKLFLFRPTNTGFELVNPVEFKNRLAEIRARHARRVGKKADSSR